MPGKNEDKIGRLHLFTSVKGGSGKTSTALCYAHELSLQYSHEVKDGNGNTVLDENNKPLLVPPKVVVIDADIRGSSMEIVLLGEETSVGKVPVDLPNGYYLRDGDKRSNFDHYGKRKYYTNLIIGMAMPSEIMFEDGYIARVADKKMDATEPSKEGEFYVALANQSQGARERFSSVAGRGDGAAVSISYFRTCFKTLLDSLDKMTWDDGTVGADFIIVDMPPGHDEYVKCILELCLAEYTKKDVTSKRLKEHLDSLKKRIGLLSEEFKRGDKSDKEKEHDIIEKEYDTFKKLLDKLLHTWEPTLHIMTLPMIQHFTPTLEYLKAVIGATRINTSHMNHVVLTIVDSYDIIDFTKTEERNEINEIRDLVNPKLAKIRADITQAGEREFSLKMRLIPYNKEFEKYGLLGTNTEGAVRETGGKAEPAPSSIFNAVLTTYNKLVLIEEDSVFKFNPEYTDSPPPTPQIKTGG